MGANARRRATEKQALHFAKPARVQSVNMTKTNQRLRQQMREITTLQQFEEIVAQAHEDHRGQIRKLLEPMLRPGLPCCGVALLAQKIGDSRFKHGPRCPARNRVVLM